MHKLTKKIFNNSYIYWLVGSLLLLIIVEIIAQGSFQNFKSLLDNHIKVLILNYIIILFSTSFIFIVDRRIFLFLIISSIWIILSISSNIMITFRGTPLTGTDLTMIKSGLSLATTYLNPTSIFIIITSITILVLLLILTWFKAPKKNNFVFSIKPLLCILMLFVSCCFIINTYRSKGVVAEVYTDLNSCYKAYGFPYSLLNTTLNKGIKKPSNYNKNTILNIEEDLKNTLSIESSTKYKKPNIIMLQLESFFDPTWMKNISFNKDPIPTFRYLFNNYSSGLLNVPALGGGTANTEFEVLTGMNIDFFAPGEIPYNTILKKEQAETIAYTLKSHNYQTHVVHNHDGKFYDRNIVYGNMGFKTFTSIEYMNNYERIPTGWAKDSVLLNQINAALNSTDTEDFIYAISVQGHGAYPPVNLLETLDIEVTSDFSEALEFNWLYYVNQLKEMDNFITNLVSMIQNSNEPTVLVMFGDHLPALAITDEDLSTGNTYTTPYVIFDNIGLPKIDKNLEAYQLSTNLLNQLGITGGILNRFHNNYWQRDDYENNLKNIQYDLLYGKKYIVSNVNPYNKSNLQMGILPIYISAVEFNDNEITIIGENFTPYSKVAINGKIQETIFVNETELKSINSNINIGDSISIKQVSSDKSILSTSSEYIIK